MYAVIGVITFSITAIFAVAFMAVILDGKDD